MKRASDRYTTAKDMAEDLRFFIQAARGTGSSPVRKVPGSLARIDSGIGATSVQFPAIGVRSTTDQDCAQGIAVIRRTRCRLLSGIAPRAPATATDYPKAFGSGSRRIEQRDPEMTFRVGLIYGPSGCGKSSMVKAGLLPRLAKHVLPVYSEATPNQTESRVLNGLRKLCPGLPPECGSG